MKWLRQQQQPTDTSGDDHSEEHTDFTEEDSHRQLLRGVPAGADALSVGRTLHQTVAPERWCITKADLKEFKARVMKEWRQGNIPPNPQFESSTHHDKRIGPSFYQVCEHYIKPLTKNAGGMSYALMKHPTGLPCDIFATHAWAEGAFEFVEKVLLAWPQGRNNLWCCMLALPQNLDIGNLLDVPLERTPFAKALHLATHVVVVPNQVASIYTRLWCVYEAFRSVEEDKMLTLPVKIRWKKGLRWVLVMYVLPVACGELLGYGIWARYFSDRAPGDETSNGSVLDEGEGRTIDILARALFLVSAMMLSVSILCRVHHYRVLLLAIHVSMAIAYPAVVVLWHEGRLAVHDESTSEWLTMGVIGVARVSSLFIDIHRWLEEDEMGTLSAQLSSQFESVQSAKCANAVDDRRIREAIAGREADVDEVVQVLMEAGTYTEELREAHSNGVDIRGLGHISYATSTCLAATLWVINAMLITEGTAYWDDESKLHGTAHFVLAAVTVLCCLGSALFLFVFALLKVFRPTRTDRAQLIVRTWSWSAVVSMLVILVGMGCPHVLPVENSEERYFLKGVPVPLAHISTLLTTCGLTVVSVLDTARQRVAGKQTYCQLALRYDDSSSEGANSDGESDVQVPSRQSDSLCENPARPASKHPGGCCALALHGDDEEVSSSDDANSDGESDALLVA